MDLVQIARFADLNEAQVAASALRASGIPAVVHDSSGQNYYVVQNFRLAVPEPDAADARAYLGALRNEPREPLER
jgi:ABC-type amino acid transport substrate-binding protein